MKANRLLSGSFWIVMLIHIIVFTGIGFTTKNWRLLALFIFILAALLILLWLLHLYSARHPENRRLAAFVLAALHKKN
jgi:hypothetical protein